MNRLTFILVILSLLASSHVAMAQFTITGEVSEVENSFFLQGPPAQSNSNVNTPQVELVPFGVNYGILGAEELKIVWKAPAGKRIQISAPAGFDNTSVEFVYRLDAPVSGATSFPTSSMGYREHLGDNPDSATAHVDFSTGMGQGLRIAIRSSLIPGQTLTFDSFEVTIDVDESYDVKYGDINVAQFGILGSASEVVAYSGSGAVSDPGNWITLIDAPLSRSELLARKASLNRKARKLKRLLRKAKRNKNRRKIRRFKRKIRQLNRASRAIVIPADFVKVTPQVM